MDALYYEVHVSVQESQTLRLRHLADNMGMCISQIVGDEPDVILTLRRDTLNAAVKSLVEIIESLTRINVEITRHKIEAAIVDSHQTR